MRSKASPSQSDATSSSANGVLPDLNDAHLSEQDVEHAHGTREKKRTFTSRSPSPAPSAHSNRKRARSLSNEGSDKRTRLDDDDRYEYEHRSQQDFHSRGSPYGYNNGHHSHEPVHAAMAYSNNMNGSNGGYSNYGFAPPMQYQLRDIYSLPPPREYQSFPNQQQHPSQYSLPSHPGPHMASLSNPVPQFINGGPPPELMPHHGGVIFTDDASTKLSDRVRRRCYNCTTTETSTWRRSNIVQGKVLCNKCGLFERTHNKPRPEQRPERRSNAKATRTPTGSAGGRSSNSGRFKNTPPSSEVYVPSSIPSSSAMLSPPPYPPPGYPTTDSGPMDMRSYDGRRKNSYESGSYMRDNGVPTPPSGYITPPGSSHSEVLSLPPIQTLARDETDTRALIN